MEFPRKGSDYYDHEQKRAWTTMMVKDPETGQVERVLDKEFPYDWEHQTPGVSPAAVIPKTPDQQLADLKAKNEKLRKEVLAYLTSEESYLHPDDRQRLRDQLERDRKSQVRR